MTNLKQSPPFGLKDSNIQTDIQVQMKYYLANPVRNIQKEKKSHLNYPD